MVPDFVHGDGHQPGPEAGHLTQAADPAYHGEHRVLDDIVNIAGTHQCSADDVVDHRKAMSDELIQCDLVAVTRLRDELHGYVVVRSRGPSPWMQGALVRPFIGGRVGGGPRRQSPRQR